MTELGQLPTPPGWFPDPSGSADLCYWDGLRWTELRTAPQGTFGPNAGPVAAGREPFRTLPLPAAISALVVTAFGLIASKLLIKALVEFRWPIAVYTLIAAVVGYGPLLAGCVVVSRRWGSGSLRADLGLRFRPVDLGWGPVTWVAAFVAQFFAAVVIITTRLPFESNAEGLSERADDRAYVISLAILAVLCAPIVEELVFRGVVMRGLLSRMPVWLGVGLQAVLFGCAHIDPIRGWKNIGLVLVLSSVGVILGGAAYLIRRLTPSMIAHALLNTVALIFVLNS